MENDCNESPEMQQYDQEASAYCKATIFIWCITGWIYAAVRWHLLLLPGVLIFFPGIFLASAIAFIIFAPRWFLNKKLKSDWHQNRKKNWLLLLFVTFWSVIGFCAPVIASIGYVELLKKFLK